MVPKSSDFVQPTAKNPNICTITIRYKAGQNLEAGRRECLFALKITLTDNHL